MAYQPEDYLEPRNIVMIHHFFLWYLASALNKRFYLFVAFLPRIYFIDDSHHLFLHRAMALAIRNPNHSPVATNTIWFFFIDEHIIWFFPYKFVVVVGSEEGVLLRNHTRDIQFSAIKPSFTLLFFLLLAKWIVIGTAVGIWIKEIWLIVNVGWRLSLASTKMCSQKGWIEGGHCLGWICHQGWTGGPNRGFGAHLMAVEEVRGWLVERGRATTASGVSTSHAKPKCDQAKL